MLSKGEHDRVCYGGIGVLGELLLGKEELTTPDMLLLLLLLLLGKKELTTPDMLLTNNWTWLGQQKVDKDHLGIVNLLHLEDIKLEILTRSDINVWLFLAFVSLFL